MDALISLVYTIIDSVCVCLFLDAFASHRWRNHRFLVGVIVQTILMYKSSRIIVCFLKKGVCQHEKIEANPICNCDSNIAFIYYWWNAGTASSTAFRLVITNHSGYIGLRRCIDNRTSAEIFRQEVRCLGVSMLPFFNQKELVVCSNQSQYQKYTSLLEKAGITYRTKARDLSSPSLFSMGTRERAGTAFQKVNYQTLYTIYVRKVDYERAVHVIIV